MNKKVRNAQLAQYIFIFGKMCRISEHSIILRLYLYSSGWRNESSNKTVNVRTRDNKVHDEFTLEAVLDKSQELVAQRILKSEAMMLASSEVLVAWLVELGADVDRRDCEKWTALMFSVSRRMGEGFRQLLEYEMSATRIYLRFIPQEMTTSSPLPSINTGWRSSWPKLSMMLSQS